MVFMVVVQIQKVIRQLFLLTIITMEVPSLDIVVAHFNEDLSWLEELKDKKNIRIFVYSKARADELPNVSFIRLTNVGREAHTYLHHIIHRYNDMADNTLFTQGNPFQHRSRADFFDNYVKNLKNKAFYPNPCTCAIPQSWKPHLMNIKVSDGNIGTWWNTVFDEPYPIKGLKVIWNAIFRIKREHVHNRPRAFYQKAFVTLRHHVNPEEGHYFERVWGNIFMI